MSWVSFARSTSFLRSRLTLVLPRLSMTKAALSPSIIGGKRRAFSPPGCSILITSAPASASIKVASGPGSKVVKSTTRRPDNGCINSPERNRPSGGLPRHPRDPPHLARPLHCSKGQSHILEGPMKPPRQFFAPLAVGAPAPLRELPVRLERMIHFVPPHNEKVRAKVHELVRQVDVVLGNLEDAIPVEAKHAA